MWTIYVFLVLFRRTLKTTQETCNFLDTTKIYIQQKSNLIWNTFQTILVNTNTLHLSVCVCCTDRSQMIPDDHRWSQMITDDPQRVKNKKVRRETKSRGVTVVLYTLWRLLWSITVHTHGKNVIYLFYTIQIQMVYWRIWGAWKKKNKSADVIWRGFDAICVRVLW